VRTFVDSAEINVEVHVVEVVRVHGLKVVLFRKFGHGSLLLSYLSVRGLLHFEIRW
jgi:hypothetical protein